MHLYRIKGHVDWNDIGIAGPKVGDWQAEAFIGLNILGHVLDCPGMHGQRAEAVTRVVGNCFTYKRHEQQANNQACAPDIFAAVARWTARPKPLRGAPTVRDPRIPSTGA